MNESLSIPENMTRAWQMGYAAEMRGWSTIDDLKLQALPLPGVADAYRMGVEWARKEKATDDQQGAA